MINFLRLAHGVILELSHAGLRVGLIDTFASLPIQDYGISFYTH